MVDKLRTLESDDIKLKKNNYGYNYQSKYYSEKPKINKFPIMRQKKQ